MVMPKPPPKTLGQAIKEAREKNSLNQKQLAALITKQNGQSISAPYLNDIEHNRRTPTSDHIIKEFSRVLKIPAEILYFAARIIPPFLYQGRYDQERLPQAWEAFRRTLYDDDQAT